MTSKGMRSFAFERVTITELNPPPTTTTVATTTTKAATTTTTAAAGNATTSKQSFQALVIKNFELLLVYPGKCLIIYCYSEWQTIYEKMMVEINNITFIKGLSDIADLENVVIVLDD